MDTMCEDVLLTWTLILHFISGGLLGGTWSGASEDELLVLSVASQIDSLYIGFTRLLDPLSCREAIGFEHSTSTGVSMMSERQVD